MNIEDQPEDQDTPKENIVYVKDRPLLTLIKYFLIVVIAAFVIIFIAGFVTGLLGMRVPYVDSGAAGNQLNSLIGGNKTHSDWNELVKNP